MRNVDYLIIGGGMAGTTAAQTIRGLTLNSSIAIICSENYELYSRVLLPKYIRGEISLEQVFLKKKEWYKQNKIELIYTTAKKLDGERNQVVCSNGEIYKYKKLLLATGSVPIKLRAEGSDLGNISYMWDLEDAKRAIAAIANAKTGVVVGGGFIGLEFAHSFRAKGMKTTIIEGGDYYWANRLDKQSGDVLQKSLENDGIEVSIGDLVEKFEPTSSAKGGLRGSRGADGKVKAVVLKSGKRFECDVVGIGVGIRSDLLWLEGSGVKVGGGVIANEYLETNVADIWTAGDCAQFYDVIFETEHMVGTWTNATVQGTVVGKNMLGGKNIFDTVSFYTINFFENSVSFIGMCDEKFADETINRGSVEENKMSRFFLKKYGSVERIVGATIINSPADVAPLTAIIKNKVDIFSKKGMLSKMEFDLKDLL